MQVYHEGASRSLSGRLTGPTKNENHASWADTLNNSGVVPHFFCGYLKIIIIIPSDNLIFLFSIQQPLQEVSVTLTVN
jgi:hypothetical protein